MSDLRINTPNSINWLFSTTNIRKAVRMLGVQNISTIEAVVLITPGKEKVLGKINCYEIYNDIIGPKGESYDKIVAWITKMQNSTEEYVYFRIKK